MANTLQQIKENQEWRLAICKEGGQSRHTEKNIFKQRLEKDEEVSRGMCGGRKRKFKERGTTSEKAVSKEPTWHVQEIAGRSEWLEWSEWTSDKKGGQRVNKTRLSMAPGP